MASPFNVRIHTYRGILQINQRLVKQANEDSVFVLDEPYIAGQVLTVPAGGGAVSSTVFPLPDDSQLLRIEVPDGQQIRYEINPNGPLAPTARVAGVGSPRLSGFDNFAWGKGYSVSVCDASFYL